MHRAVYAVISAHEHHYLSLGEPSRHYLSLGEPSRHIVPRRAPRPTPYHGVVPEGLGGISELPPTAERVLKA
jgi:hypothetical protein